MSTTRKKEGVNRFFFGYSRRHLGVEACCTFWGSFVSKLQLEVELGVWVKESRRSHRYRMTTNQRSKSGSGRFGR